MGCGRRSKRATRASLPAARHSAGRTSGLDRHLVPAGGPSVEYWQAIVAFALIDSVSIVDITDAQEQGITPVPSFVIF